MWTPTTREHYSRRTARYQSDLTDGEWDVIEPHLPPASLTGRPRIWDMREIVNAIFYVMRGGIAWRLLPRDFPPWSTVYRWFAAWRDGCVFEKINHALVMADRERTGRAASPSAAIIDSQSVKTTEAGGVVGYDAGKKIKGRKRHALVDTDGRALVLEPHSASIQDRDGGGPLLQASRPLFPFIERVFADSGYCGDRVANATISQGFAEINLGMARRMRKRHEHLALALPGGMHVVLHDRDPANKAMFVTQPLEDPLRGVALLPRPLAVFLQDLIDDGDERIELRPHHRLAAPISRRHGKPQHLLDRSAVDAEQPGGFSSAQTIDDYGTPHPRIKLHALHPRPRPKARRLTLAEFCSGQQPDYPAASVVEFCTGALKRLQGAFADLFGLTVSQGGLMNMLRRAQGVFIAERDSAVAALRQAKVIASDETGVRIEGSNAYHWVFRCAQAVVHQAAPTRGAVVVRTVMDGHRPDVWCSDRYAAQQGHATAHQTCLAHLARDVAYADEASEDMLPSRLKLWLQRAFALADGVETFAASTIAAKRRALERSLDDILATSTSCDLARHIQNKFRRARDQLLTFADWPGLVEATNNGCERALRPAVIQRKVTNGYRAMWAAQGEADIRTVVDTARLSPGTNAFSTILQTVSA